MSSSSVYELYAKDVVGAASPVGVIAVHIPNAEEFTAPSPKSFQAYTLKLYKLPVLYITLFNS